MNALLVIDVQESLTAKKLYNKDTFVASINSAIKHHTDNNDIVVYVQHNNNFLVNGSPEWELSKEITFIENSLCIQKFHGNAFKDTALDALLKEQNIRSVTVCGLVSHGCVRASCEGALEKGYKVYLLKNGHTCWGADAKNKIEKAEHDLEVKGIDIIEV